MKNIILITLSLLLLLSSCSKKRRFEQIAGLDLFDENAVPMGTLGNTDDYFKDAEFNIIAYPIPAFNVQYISFRNTSASTKTYRLRVVSAHFKQAPDFIPKTQWFEYSGLAGRKINVDNLGGNPEAVHFSTEFIINANGYYNFVVDFSNFKEGFYKVIVDADGGGRYTRSLWVWRR